MAKKTFAKFTKVEIVDENGNPIDITSDGKLKIEIINDDVFKEMLLELKMIKFGIEQIIGDKITNLDTE